MKYLVVLLVVTVGLWLWRQGRRDGMRERDAALRTPPPPLPAVAAPQPMVRCARCGLHLPAGDAVTGGRDRRGPRQIRDHAGAHGVPHVDHAEDLRRIVEAGENSRIRSDALG